MEFVSSLASADRGKIQTRSTGSNNERHPLTTVTYVHARPVISPVSTNIGSSLPKGPLTGVNAGRGLQFNLLLRHSNLIKCLF